jgi:CRP-like cAMP-binding protein
MQNPVLRKLEYGAQLTHHDRQAIVAAFAEQRRLPAGTDIIREGDNPTDVHAVIEGIACRYKLLEDGRRQIMALLLPGDFCDLHIHILREMDHNIGTLTDATIVEIRPGEIDDLVSNKRINRALWWATLVDEGTLREWLVSMGQRDAPEQMAHVFCEVFLRLRAVGLINGTTCRFSITQSELGDLMGISAVHVNRTLMILRDEGLVQWEKGLLDIPDFERLSARGGFDPNYLHLNEGTRSAPSVAEAGLKP